MLKYKKIIIKFIHLISDSPLTENFQVGTGLFRKYGPFVRVWLGPELTIFLQDPEDVEVSKITFK